MIRTETFYVNEREFTRTYSDEGRYVVREGVSYAEACDPSEFGRIYVEGDVMPSEEQDAQAAEILEILLGGDDA